MQANGHQTPGSGSGRARRDAAARAMQGWHSRLHGNGEVGDPIIKVFFIFTNLEYIFVMLLSITSCVNVSNFVG